MLSADNIVPEKNEIINKLNKEIYFYEIIPIVDNKNYLNDPFELKQLGLTRKRASVAVTLLKSLNSQNKIYLSTDIIVSDKNERGFIIKKRNGQTVTYWAHLENISRLQKEFLLNPKNDNVKVKMFDDGDFDSFLYTDITKSF